MTAATSIGRRYPKMGLTRMALEAATVGAWVWDKFGLGKPGAAKTYFSSDASAVF